MDLRHFTFVSQTIDNLERELKHQQTEQLVTFDRLKRANLEQKIKPLVERYRKCWIHCRSTPYERTTRLPSSSSLDSYSPPSSPCSVMINRLLARPATPIPKPLTRLLKPAPKPVRIPLTSTSYHSCEESLGTKENPIIIDDERPSIRCEGCKESGHDLLNCPYEYRLIGAEFVPIPKDENPMEEIYVLAGRSIEL